MNIFSYFFSYFKNNLLNNNLIDISNNYNKENNYDKSDNYMKSINLDIDYNMKRLLYETYISIDSIVFYIGTYNLSTNQINNIIEKVLIAKKKIFTDKNIISEFLNISEVPDYSKNKDLLNFRFNLIEKDKSKIFKKLIKENNDKLKENFNIIINNNDNKILKNGNINSFINKKLINYNFDNQYKDMILRLNENIINNDNINQKIKIEKREFYANFKNINPNEIKRLEKSLSLGSFIIRTEKLLELIKKIEIPKKTEKIREWITEIMKTVSELELKMQNKNYIEQKVIIINFLKDFLYRRNPNYDKVYNVRSEILELSCDNLSEIIEENIKQENNIKNTIEMIENIKRRIYIKSNRDITENFIKYLLSYKEEDKKDLLNKI